MELSIDEEFLNNIKENTQWILFNSHWATFEDMKDINEAFEGLKTLRISVV